MSESASGEASTRTVVVAVAVNLAIAFAKGAAAALTGSAALWAETAHSLADTGNEVLLFVGLRRSGRPADERHPFGYGQERWFWAFLAAIGIFVVGGVLSIDEGVDAIRHPKPLTNVPVGVGVLVVSLALEALSWRTAHAQLREEARARRRSLAEHVRSASDPTATTVLLEDSAAIVGIGLALGALVLHWATGWTGWDAGASILIGLLLVGVAFLVARRSKGLLIDESPPPDVLERLRGRIVAEPWVGAIESLTAVYIGPQRVLVMVRLLPVAEVARLPAEELMAKTYDLRASLCAVEVIADVEITLVPGADERSST
ncbi:cation diffusion facilitator family transporter [Planosporangium thailandense]|uniref:Cation diffusion facilitator family transporter n=1 Tax=Planosporangium thailandense TaxID=765197 RepID=A0ABX0Y8L0_9ACTN|nr:cation diffusion facilitator family transporter [Planosporangium thailandense]NJC73609.1 cation diffusion facilitator family transporter [Planosporangium thailandense]